MADLANVYNDVTTKANAELNEYKEKVICSLGKVLYKRSTWIWNSRY